MKVADTRRYISALRLPFVHFSASSILQSADSNQKHGRRIVSGTKLFFHLARAAAQLFAALQIKNTMVCF
jgi:hypothetical protein